MSKTISPTKVVRCPLCHVGGIPAHVGHGVLVCQSCMQVYRVVCAQKGKTGKKLGEYTKAVVNWEKGGRP